MTDQPAETPASPPAQAPQPEDMQPPAQPKPAEPETDWKAEARKWEQRAKENVEKAKQYDALEEANKTEAQKLEDRAAKAEKELESTRLDALRSQVALAKGLTPSQAKRLVGTTEQELAADADELLADIAPGKPRGDVGQGARGAQAAAGDPAQAFGQFMTKQLGQ